MPPPHPSGRARPDPVAASSLLVMLGLAALALTACDPGLADTDGEAATDYVADLAAACERADEALDALPRPPEEISPDDFAVEVARVLEAEAEDARRLRPPDELEDDHRAFVQNTDDQARTWRAVARTVDTDLAAVDDLRTRILELSLGRDDLAGEMGVEPCRRGDG